MDWIVDAANVSGYEWFTGMDERLLTPTSQHSKTWGHSRPPHSRDAMMNTASNSERRSQTGAKALALACFVIAAGLLIASLFISSPARAGKSGHPPVQAAIVR